MKNFRVYAWLLIVWALIGSCTTKYSYPHSAKELARWASETYGNEMTIVSDSLIVRKDWTKSRRCILRDTERKIDFKISSWVHMDRHLPFYETDILCDYPCTLMKHYHKEVLEIAANYRLRFDPPHLGEPDYKTMSSEESMRHRSPEDQVFIHSREQIEQVADLFDTLSHLYNFKFGGYYFDHYYNFPRLTVYYLPEDEEDIEKALYIKQCRYVGDRDETVRTKLGIDKRKTVYFIPDAKKIKKEMYNEWDARTKKVQNPV